MTLTGAGLYVGTVLNVTNPSAEWWGKRDEKIYLDAIPFTRGLRFDLEAMHNDRDVTLTLDAVAYWYGGPLSTSNVPQMTRDLCRIPPLP